MVRPDRLELAIRFACGFAVTWFVVGRFAGTRPTLVAAALFGYLALRYGDAFWYGLGRLYPWRRPD
jgi:hypothetical protein